MAEIYLLTGYDGFFGQSRKPWVSIGTPRLVSELEALGHKVHVHTFHEVVNGLVDIQDSIVFYTFSHRLNLQGYIRDCLHYLADRDNTIIPSLELFFCHENKGWQELMRRKYGIDDLTSRYFSSKRELAGYGIDYPVVVKTLTGSNSQGVSLARNGKELLRAIRSHEGGPGIWLRLDLLRRKYLRKGRTYPGFPDYDPVSDQKQYKDYIVREIPFVLQEFVPDLTYDYRVVALGDKYFVSKRLTREGDFRASGAKRLTFDFDLPPSVLDYARDLHQRIRSPHLSIDLGERKDGRLCLFEFQASHFGVNTIVRSRGYYSRDTAGWRFVESKPILERYLAQGLDTFLRG